MIEATYWIVASSPNEKKALEDLGITVGPWDENDWCFLKCTIPPEALDKLDKHWDDKYYWGREG